ncbi:sensor histidine kinase [Paracandidimonas soli]|uniref:sensor histidine kinase n=1 Tax=Paracandidimonas soli TaxID=1917182 RepID=UPI001404559B|nr:HAMP domain-containing sensor histidine kinase [Paracandidimonas soli]
MLAILLTVSLFRLADIQRAMRNNVNANMVWVIYQTHVESLMLANAVQHRLVDPGSDSDLLHRYQMLLSRISVLNDGPQKRALQAMGIAETLTIQADAVVKLAELFENGTIDAAGYAQIRQALSIFSATLQSASGKAMMAQWEEAGERIDTYRNAVLTVFFLMIGIWICGAVLSVQLLLALKKTRDNERIRQRGIELQKQLENERKISDLYRSFGSMVSHQFRTPLAIIDATMQRLIRAGDRMAMEEIRHRATKARQATQRLNQLIENILQADRFMEQLDVAMRPCRLADIARQAVAEQQAIAPRRAIHVVDETGGESTVLCDSMLTSQIIGNLLSNAIKYSEEDTAVSIRTYRQNGQIYCQVSDQGRGISAHDLTHVFKRYFRAKATTDIVGTGIGLHIAMELAVLQNGTILACSEPGVGSSFTLQLPCHRHLRICPDDATQAAAPVKLGAA